MPYKLPTITSHSTVSEFIEIKFLPRIGLEGRDREQSRNSTTSLTSAIGTGGLLPGKRSSTHCTTGLKGPKAGLDGRGRLPLHQDSIPVPPNPQQVGLSAISWSTTSKYMKVFRINTDPSYLQSFNSAYNIIFRYFDKLDISYTLDRLKNRKGMHPVRFRR